MTKKNDQEARVDDSQGPAHTHGPWTCHVGTLGSFVGDPADQRIAPHYILNKQGSGVQIVTQDEAWANARLIAAAPELLAALYGLGEQVIASHNGWCFDSCADNGLHDHSPACAAARAALAKAEKG